MPAHTLVLKLRTLSLTPCTYLLLACRTLYFVADWKLLMSSCYISEHCSPSVSINSVNTAMKAVTEELSTVIV